MIQVIVWLASGKQRVRTLRVNVEQAKAYAQRVADSSFDGMAYVTVEEHGHEVALYHPKRV